MGRAGHRGLANLVSRIELEGFLANAPCRSCSCRRTDVDIVNIADRPSLTCGPVLAAIDLTGGVRLNCRLASKWRRNRGPAASADDRGAGETRGRRRDRDVARARASSRARAARMIVRREAASPKKSRVVRCRKARVWW
jgi:hypothetical protein